MEDKYFEICDLAKLRVIRMTGSRRLPEKSDSLESPMFPYK
jgi:hypothetical protein